LHEAADEGHVAGYNAVRGRIDAFERRAPLMVCFSAPNIAQVGRAVATVGEINPVS
jgi:dihydrolipoamide dehydrogenase